MDVGMEKVRASMTLAIKGKLYRAWFPTKEIIEKMFTRKKEKGGK